MKRHDYTISPATTLRGRSCPKRFAGAIASILVAALLAFALCMPPAALAQGNPSRPSSLIANGSPKTESATVLVYLNGSDLESEAGEASADIAEMLQSGAGDKVNVLVETLGTRDWQDYGIASDRAQRYRANKGTLELVDDSLGQLDTTAPETLSDFISWGVSRYPADRYILLFWDHGAGPVYGFGYDEFQSDYSALTLDEIKKALDANPSVHFDIIGMDCCIMSSLETCSVLQPYCDYTVLSEDFEPGVGWSYAKWLRALEDNPGIETTELGQIIVDDMISAVQADKENGDATLALIDESAIDELFSSWIKFAYAHEDELLASNYSQELQWQSRPSELRANGKPFNFEDAWGYWDTDNSYVTMTDYFITDMLEVASSIESEEASALKAEMDNAIVHFASTSGETGLNGIGVTLPYGDAEFYDELTRVFTSCGLDSAYIDWLEAFVNAEGANSFYDYSSHGFAHEGPFFGGSNSNDPYGFGPGQGDYYEYGSDYSDYYGYGYGSGDYYGYGSGNYYGYGSDDYYDYDSGYGDYYGYDSGYANDYGYGYGSGYSDRYGYDSHYGSPHGFGSSRDYYEFGPNNGYHGFGNVRYFS